MDNSAHNYAVTNAYKTCGENGVLNGRNECVPRIRNNTPGAPVDLHGLFGFNGKANFLQISESFNEP